jgi:hypothetical protein
MPEEATMIRVTWRDRFTGKLMIFIGTETIALEWYAYASKAGHAYPQLESGDGFIPTGSPVAVNWLPGQVFAA